MVSRQLVYVTGMLEVILAPSNPSGSSKRVAGLSEASGRLRPPAKFSWYPGKLGRRP